MSTTDFTVLCSLILALAGCAVPPRDAIWPSPGLSSRIDPGDARVAEQPFCVGARSWSAGSLGKTVLYRTRQRGKRLAVGYFVYWSEERPYGKNVFSYTALPALAMDAVYSHFLWFFPGLKDALYGAGDIEGVLVEYDVQSDGSLDVVSGVADDATHGPVQLSRADLLDAQGRVVVLTDVWSHQLGAHGAAQFASARGADLKCYAGASIEPMTSKIARVFRLGNERHPLRGNPAWLEPVLPGQSGPAQQVAKAKAVFSGQ